jgi:hypothetical protein
MKSKPRAEIVQNPLNFPVEISMLFEKAAYGPVRVPEAGKGFDTANEALGAKMVMARWKAQMKRSKESPKPWLDLIAMIQFTNPEKDADGWHFFVRPFSGSVVDLAKSVVGTPVAADEFWKTYTGA